MLLPNAVHRPLHMVHLRRQVYLLDRVRRRHAVLPRSLRTVAPVPILRWRHALLRIGFAYSLKTLSIMLR